MTGLALVTGLAQLATVVAGAPLVTGLMRQVRAALEGRVGGGLLQPWRDIRKQFGKQQLRPEGTTLVFVAAPLMLAATTVVIAAVTISTGTNNCGRAATE